MSEVTSENLDKLRRQLEFIRTVQKNALRPLEQGLTDALQQFSDKREEFALKKVIELVQRALEPEPFFAVLVLNLALGPIAGAAVSAFTSRALRPVLGQRKVFTVKTPGRIKGQKVPRGSGKKYKYQFPDKETLKSFGFKIKKQGKKKATVTRKEQFEIYENQEIFDLLNSGSQAILETSIDTAGEIVTTPQVDQKSSHANRPSSKTAATSIKSVFDQFINDQSDAIDNLYYLLVGRGAGAGQIEKLSQDDAEVLLELLLEMYPTGQVNPKDEVNSKDAFAVFVETCIWVRQFGGVENIFEYKEDTRRPSTDDRQTYLERIPAGANDYRTNRLGMEDLPAVVTVTTDKIKWKVPDYYLDYWFKRFPHPRLQNKEDLTTEQRSFQAHWESLSDLNRFFRNTDTNKKARNQKLGKELIAYFKNIERALQDIGPSSPDELFVNETTT